MKCDKPRTLSERVSAFLTVFVFIFSQSPLSSAERLQQTPSSLSSQPSLGRAIPIDEARTVSAPRQEVRRLPIQSLSPEIDRSLQSADVFSAIPSRPLSSRVRPGILPLPLRRTPERVLTALTRRAEESRGTVRLMGGETSESNGPMVVARATVINPQADLISTASARIEWQTSPAADSRVEYSVNSDMSGSFFTVLDPTYVTEHQVDLTGLTQNTTYYFRVHSSDGTESTVSDIFSFKTLTTAVNSWAPSRGIGSTPVVSFSADETMVSISYKNKTDNTVNDFVLARPVISDWNYQPTGSGRIYWVDGTAGLDTNNGVESSPLKSIKRAIALARAGDVIYVKEGTYVENVVINKSGTAANPFVLSAAPGALGKVTIKLPEAFARANPGSGVIVINNSTYVTVNGFVLEGPKGLAGMLAEEHYSQNGVSIFTSRDGVRITNNIIYNNLHCGIKAGINDGTGRVLMEGNIIFGNGTNGLDHGIYSPRSNVIINGNVIFNNAGIGVHAYVGGASPDNQIITRNVIMGHPASGILMSGKNNIVRHNTAAYNQIGIAFFRDGAKNNIAEYNIFSNSTSGMNAWYDDAGSQRLYPTGNQLNHNLYTTALPRYPTNVATLGPDERVGSPGFVSPRTGDFRQTVNAGYQDRGAFSGPELLSIASGQITDRSAVITWTTDIPGDSWVEYGPQGGTMTQVSAAAFVTSHSMTITGLAPEAQYTFRIRSRDKVGSAEMSQNFNFTTAVKNVLPVLTPISAQTGNENSTITFTVSALDPDAITPNLVYSLADAPSGAVIDPATGVFSWTPTYAQGRVEPYSITVKVFDGLDYAEQQVLVTVNHVNRPSTLTLPTLTPSDEGAKISFVLTGADLDGDTLTLAMESGPEGAVFQPGTGQFEWTPSFTQSGSHSIVFSVFDGTVKTEETLVVQVNNKNQAPALTVPAAASGNENAVITFTAEAADADGTAVFAYGLADAPSGAVIDPATGVFSWTPTYDQGRADPYVVKVRVSDGTDTTEKTISITVAHVNRIPVILEMPAQTLDENQEGKILITISDPDQDTLTVSSDSLPAGAVLEQNPPALRWTPNFQQAGEYAIKITVSDGNLTADYTIAVTVRNTQEPARIIQVAPGQSVQAAIDEARAGDTVLLLVGTHTGPVVLKAGVDLAGENAETTILDGNFQTRSHVIRALGNNFIENLTVTGGGQYAGAPSSAIQVEGDNVRVRRNRVIDNLDYGIYVATEGDVLIEENLILNNHIGVQLSKDATVIRYNTFVDNEMGLNILNGEKTIVENNIFTGSKFQSIYEFAWGQVPTRGYAVVRNNTFYSNTERGSFYGSATPPSVESLTEGNAVYDPGYEDPSSGNYAALNSPDRGAYLSELLKKTLDRAALYSCAASVSTVMQGNQLSAYRISYPDGTVEELNADGTVNFIYPPTIPRPRLN